LAAGQTSKITRLKPHGGPLGGAAAKSSPRASRAKANAANPRKSDLTRQRILQAAARVFRDQGYAGTRLSDIAAAADMKAGSLYYHFDSREALVEEVVLEGVQRAKEAVQERLQSLPAGATALQKLEAMIETHLIFVLLQNDISSASIQLVWQIPLESRERTLVVQRAYGAVWRRVLEAARDTGEIRSDVNLSAIRMSILGALNWAADWYHPTGAPPRQIARDIVAMVLHGLATRPEAKARRRGERR
jgi:AcrR family transcriptional regulator